MKGSPLDLRSSLMAGKVELESCSVSLDLLEPGENMRSAKSLHAGISDLADSISANGLLQPLIVVDHIDGGGTYVVIAGNRRLLALRELASKSSERFATLFPEKSIPVRVLSPYDESEIGDAQIDGIQMAENMSRVDPTLTDVAKGIRRMYEGGVDIPDLAAMCGTHHTHIRQLLSIDDNLDPKAVALINAKVLTHGMAYELSKMPKGQQRQICQKLIAIWLGEGSKGKAKAEAKSMEELQGEAAVHGMKGAAPRQSPYIPYPKLAKAAMNIRRKLLDANEAKVVSVLEKLDKREEDQVTATSKNPNFLLGMMVAFEVVSGVSPVWSALEGYLTE